MVGELKIAAWNDIPTGSIDGGLLILDGANDDLSGFAVLEGGVCVTGPHGG